MDHSSVDHSAATTGDSNWGSTVNLTPAEAVFADREGELLTYTSVSARYVLFEVNANHSGGADNLVAVAEVRFIDAVPEPSTTALLGLGGLALILRRRK